MPGKPHDPAPRTSAKKRKSPPHPFLVEALASLDPEVRPMFSGYAVYIGDKIVCMLRESPRNTHDNGLWLVFSDTADHAGPAIRREFPSLRPIAALKGKIVHWLLIPSDSPTFESESLYACDLILRRDPRIGRIPQSRQSKPRQSQPR